MINADNRIQIETQLNAVAGVNKHKQWITSDLHVVNSSCLSRILWAIAKYFECLRKFFYGIDLNTSKESLASLGQRISQIDNNENLSRLFQTAVENFNQIAPKHQIIHKTVPAYLLATELNTEKPSFENILRLVSKEIADTRFFVAEQLFRPEVRKQYTLASATQIAAPVGPKIYRDHFNPRTSNLAPYNHSTTLTNIIATNELKFTAEQVKILIRKLIEVKADFTAVDHSNAFIFFNIQNNPLKSLIALGSDVLRSINTDYDDILSEFIQYIGTLDDRVKHTIFDHEDNYPVDGNNTPVRFLIRQGKEDLAVQVVNSGAHVHEDELLLACASFGTTSVERPNGVILVEKIRQSLLEQNGRISKKTIEGCLTRLKYASSEYVEQKKNELSPRLNNLIGEWLVEETHRSMDVRSKLGMNASQFRIACEDPNSFPAILEAFTVLNMLEARENIRHMAEFHDEFRILPADPLPVVKRNYVKDGIGRDQLTALISLFERDLKAFSN
jgi:hypothetical protein